MINEIYSGLQEHLAFKGDVALEIRMHPSTFAKCMDCDYNEVSSAFELSPNLYPRHMFSPIYRLVIDFDLDDDEWRIQSPRI